MRGLNTRTFTLRLKFYSVTIQMKLLQRYFHMVPFVFSTSILQNETCQSHFLDGVLPGSGDKSNMSV